MTRAGTPIKGGAMRVLIPPRLLSRPHLRDYLGNIPWADIEALMDRGMLPGPMWKLKSKDPKARWDRRAVDQALDISSGIIDEVTADILDMDRASGFR
jgi:hypothetical protein